MNPSPKKTGLDFPFLLLLLTKSMLDTMAIPQDALRDTTCTTIAIFIKKTSLASSKFKKYVQVLEYLGAKYLYTVSIL